MPTTTHRVYSCIQIMRADMTLSMSMIANYLPYMMYSYIHIFVYAWWNIWSTSRFVD